jgi:hypothetical protein
MSSIKDAAVIVDLYKHEEDSCLTMYLEEMGTERLLAAFNVLQAGGQYRLFYIRCNKPEHRTKSLMFVINDGTNMNLYSYFSNLKYKGWKSYTRSTSTVCDNSCSVKNASVMGYEVYPVLVQNWQNAVSVLPTLLEQEFDHFFAEGWMRACFNSDCLILNNRPQPRLYD